MTLSMYQPSGRTTMVELNSLFNSLKRPFGRGEIVRFNLAYQRIYPALNRSDRVLAEELVDLLLLDLESESLADKIYGVC